MPTESRNPLDLIYTLPGTAPPALSDKDLAEGDRASSYRRTPEEAGIFSLTGGTPFSNNLTIEGLDNNDDRAARERFLPSTHAVEEVQVITNQFSAEYGRASGGRVNLRLRGGANRIHGHGFYYFRDESLNANPFARNADQSRGKRIPFQNHNPGGSVGGPIKHDKLSTSSRTNTITSTTARTSRRCCQSKSIPRSRCPNRTARIWAARRWTETANRLS